MLKWVDGKKFLPVDSGMYFIIANGRKEIYHLYDFDAEKINYYDTFLWLDETAEEEAKNGIISSLLSNKLTILPYKKNLINLFGIKKADKIISKTNIKNQLRLRFFDPKTKQFK